MQPEPCTYGRVKVKRGWMKPHPTLFGSGCTQSAAESTSIRPSILPKYLLPYLVFRACIPTGKSNETLEIRH